jgi:hypothetical protein
LWTSTRAGGRRRENSKEFQVARANVSQVVESSCSDQDRVVLVGDFLSIAKGHFSYAFDTLALAKLALKFL